MGYHQTNRIGTLPVTFEISPKSRSPKKLPY
jgi:hypothetical protein